MGVQRLGDEFVELAKELGEIAVIVADDEVEVVAHRDPCVKRHVELRSCFREAISDDFLDHSVGAEQELALGAPARDEVGTSGDDLTWFHRGAPGHSAQLRAAREATVSTPRAKVWRERIREVGSAEGWKFQLLASRQRSPLAVIVPSPVPHATSRELAPSVDCRT
jgi:hypothetical protein